MVRSTFNEPAMAQPEKHKKNLNNVYKSGQICVQLQYHPEAGTLHHFSDCCIELITDHPNTAKRINNLQSQDAITV